MSLTLIHNISKFSSTPQGDVRLIKGFGSATGEENIDRHGEYVKDPFQFDLENFQNSPQLWVDHELIRTPEGNRVAAGKVLKSMPAYIHSEDPTNSENWVVNSLSTNEFVSIWPKSKSPDLTLNSQGLFIVAEVNHPFAVELVDKGELGTFSWSGLAQIDANAIKAIDLHEFSLVHTQSQKSSTFMLIDENDPTLNLDVDFTDCEICSLAFMKNAKSLADVKNYVKDFSIDGQISQTDDSYIVKMNNKGLDTSKQFLYTRGDVAVLAAPNEKKLKMPIVGDLQTKPITENLMDQNSTETQGTKIDVIVTDIDSIRALAPQLDIAFEKNATMVDGETSAELSLYSALLKDDAELASDGSCGSDCACHGDTSKSQTDATNQETEDTSESEQSNSDDQESEAQQSENSDSTDQETESVTKDVDSLDANIVEQITVIAEAVTALTDQVNINSERINTQMSELQKNILSQVDSKLAGYQKEETANSQREKMKNAIKKLTKITPSETSNVQTVTKSAPTKTTPEAKGPSALDFMFSTQGSK